MLAFEGWQEGTHTGTPGLEFQIAWWLNPQNAQVRRGMANAVNMVIPSTVTIQGISYNVSIIAEHGFINFSTMTSITIPNSVSSIRNRAFLVVQNIFTISLPRIS